VRSQAPDEIGDLFFAAEKKMIFLGLERPQPGKWIT
jgi:hypothetical protein